jgi:hypothetical protein
MPYSGLRGHGELVPSTIPLVGLTAKAVYFGMALSANALQPPLLSLLVSIKIRWAMLAITTWFSTWVVVECGGGPSGPNLILENAFLSYGPSLAREPVVLGVKRVRCSKRECRFLIEEVEGAVPLLGSWEVGMSAQVPRLY